MRIFRARRAALAFALITSSAANPVLAAQVANESIHLTPAQREQAGDRVENANENAGDARAEKMGDQVEKQTDGNQSRWHNMAEETGDALGDIGRRAKHLVGR